jgi:hypothetical protein
MSLRPSRTSPHDQYPTWSVLAAGVSAGIAVAGFVVTPWPVDLLVVPALAAWALVLSGLSRPDGWKRPGHLLVLTGITAFGLGGLMLGALALFVR